MTKYERQDADVFLCPGNPQENFNNESAGTIQALTDAQVLPYSLVTDEFPVIKPKRQDEEGHGVGQGRNPNVVFDKQFEIGAGTIPNKVIFGLMIPKIGGDVAITHTAAEVSTVTCVADVSGSLNNTYFEFDVMLADGTLKKYFIWFNINTAGVAPTPAPVAYGTARTAAVVAEATNATADDIAAATKLVIDALTDVTCTVASAVLTITNDQMGAVDDTHDGAGDGTGFTFAVSTNGRTKIVITFDDDSIERQNFGFHIQRILAGQDRIMDIFGVSIASYEMSCEDGGIAEESIDYTVASFKTSATDITKMYSPNGSLWNKGKSAFSSAKKNYGWHSFNENFTFTSGGELLCTKRAFSVRIENELSHNYDGGGEFASDVDFSLRTIEVGIEAKVKDVTIYELADQHPDDYANAIVVQVKGIRGSDTNDYIMWDFSSLRMLPIDEAIAAPSDWNEKYNIKMKPAPGCVSKCTIEGYLSFEYFVGKAYS